MLNPISDFIPAEALLDGGHKSSAFRSLQEQLKSRLGDVAANLDWLSRHMPPYFFITMGNETEALVKLALHLNTVKDHNALVLADQADKLILARCDRAGSLYETLEAFSQREIAYSEIIHSNAPLPATAIPLEVLRFDFESRTDAVAPADSPAPSLPASILEACQEAVARDYPDYPLDALPGSLAELWQRHSATVRISPSDRIARMLWVYRRTHLDGGFFFDVQSTVHGEARVVFGLAQPPRRHFLLQLMEVFRRLAIGVRRAYSQILNLEQGPHFIGTFYIRPQDVSPGENPAPVYDRLRAELYNTQILAIDSFAYQRFLAPGLMTGEDASLAEAIIAFCHTNLSHSQPDRFDLDAIKYAFEAHPDILLTIIALFRSRFDPLLAADMRSYEKALGRATAAVENFNTGQHYLDDIRRVVFQTALAMVRHCLKTNFFVAEKRALAFRFDPAYLQALGPDLRGDLPESAPFRITFFFGRYGIGYHIGFSDIARGGWRTLICRTPDEYLSCRNTLFREVFVLAHTQHLKNKDIYEGGSKMTAICDVRDLAGSEAVTHRLYKLQFAFINAFLDIFVTEAGVACHPAVVDYYRQEEPIELGPDENMHDTMIETISRTAAKRGYVLGIGIMSSKRVGINHKAYGVTSLGVIQTAEITLAQLGIDMRCDAFKIRMTGGPFGDVAGNSIRLMLEQCPQFRLVALVDGSGGLFDPQGADHRELERITLRADLDHFDPQRLHPGGTIVYRNQQRREAMRQLYRKVTRTEQGTVDCWITADEFHRELNRLTFEVGADLFLPCGGRPETIDATNWTRFFDAEGRPGVRAIVEGANSFISPEARREIEDRGVILLRDATANKCGVICSSYEIIANLLMREEEFIAHKEAYVADVIDILRRRASDEANLILARHRQAAGKLRYTEISVAISQEINAWYARLFEFFQSRPELAAEPGFSRVILSHLPLLIGRCPQLRARIQGMPPKIRAAILACEIATRIVYRQDWEGDLENRLRRYVDSCPAKTEK